MKNLFDIFSIRPVLRDRIEAAIVSLQLQFDRQKATAGPEAVWVKQVERALDEARNAVTKREADQSWNYIHLVEEHLVWGLTPDELVAKARSLRAEAKKIGGSRAEAVLNILGKDDTAITQAKVYEAQCIRDAHYDTKYHKVNLRRASLYSLAWLLSLIVCAGIGWMAFLASLHPEKLMAIVTETAAGVKKIYVLHFWQEAISGLFLGTLGASFSMAYTMTSSSLDVKIPDQIMGAMVTVIRLAIGGTAAFIALLILRTGMLDALLSSKLVDQENLYGYLVIAFISGFSERWIVNVIQVISKEKEIAREAGA